MARSLADRVALGYALNARMHALWGIEPAPERLAIGMELGEIADDIGDELLSLHGHMWRIRELLAQGDVDAVHEEIARFGARDTGPVHPLEASFGFNVSAMMAQLEGDFEKAEELGQRAMEVAEGHDELAPQLLCRAHAVDLVAARRLGRRTGRSVSSRARPDRVSRGASATRALVHAELGDTGAALARTGPARGIGMENVADDQTEGVTLSVGAATCSVIGARPVRFAPAGSTRRCVSTPALPSWSGRRRRRASDRPTTTWACWRESWAT